jgi:quinol monooxygenase YgiN
MTSGIPMWTSIRCGKLTALRGQRDALSAALRRQGEALQAAGCELFAVRPAQDDPDVVWVTEVWTSAEAQRASLRQPAVRSAIVQARSLLAADPGPLEPTPERDAVALS